MRGVLSLFLLIVIVGCSVVESPENNGVERSEETMLPAPNEQDLLYAVEQYYIGNQTSDFKRVLEVAAEDTEFYKNIAKMFELNPKPKLDGTEYTIVFNNPVVSKQNEKVYLVVEEVRAQLVEGGEMSMTIKSKYTFVWSDNGYKISNYEIQ